MKKKLSLFVLFLFDIFAIFVSILLATILKNLIYGNEILYETTKYVNFFLIYFVFIVLLVLQGVYTRRYDFWSESKIIVKSSFLGLFLSLAFLALIKINYDYSRAVCILTFAILLLFLPFVKLFVKNTLFKFGIWRKRAKIIGETNEFELEIFTNHYLGYVRAKGQNYESLFIASGNMNNEELNEIIEQNIKDNKEILFTPMLNSYDFSRAYIYNIFNSRTNLFAIQNALQNKFNIALKRSLDIFLILFALPLLAIVFIIVSLIIKLQEPNEKIFFSQPRLGLNGRHFRCYKFRSMCMNQDFMSEWLKKNPDEEKYYKVFKKYKNDPRITKIGKILRKTSLDELPQILNVLKGEMSIVGPRPYLPSELPDLEKYIDIILSVKPGITGIWQVSGRSDVDFETRAKMDAWYMKNWSIWSDIVIIIKTFKVVLARKGAS